jgi:hypothetical protein
MRTQKRVRLGLVFFLTMAVMSSNGATGISARFDAGEPAHRQAGSYASVAPSPIIADHTVVDQYDDIPQEYIDKVKEMWLNVPGESHSSGYRKGL